LTCVGGGRSGRRAAALLAVALFATGAARAYESDQYSNRLVDLADSREVLDARVNRALAEIAAEWRGPENRWHFARKVYWKLGGMHWVDHIERWAMDSDQVEKLPQRKHESIFSDAPMHVTRVNWFFGVGPTLRLAGSLVGSDKLGHFFSQGIKYYASHLLGWDDDHVLGRGRFNERWIFGQLTTSVYSNADLVANYEGYRFYRSLFEEGIVAGKGPIVAFHADRAEILRPFTWADHVNDYWDEATNPSHVSEGLERYFLRTLPSLCDDYREAPERYVPANGEALAARYAGLGLKPAPELRLDRICAEERAGREPESQADGAGRGRTPR